MYAMVDRQIFPGTLYLYCLCKYHSLLVDKLEAYGVCNTNHLWMCSMVEKLKSNIMLFTGPHSQMKTSIWLYCCLQVRIHECGPQFDIQSIVYRSAFANADLNLTILILTQFLDFRKCISIFRVSCFLKWW